MAIVDEMADTGFWPEYFVICMDTTNTDWATLQAKAEVLRAAKRPTWFLTRIAKPTARDATTLNNWATAAVALSQAYTGKDVEVCANYGRVALANGRHMWRVGIGHVSGLFARSQVNTSIGWRGKNGLDDITLPDKYSKAMATALVDGRFIPYVRRLKPRAVCIDKAPTMADPSSVFNRVEVIRTTYKAIRLAEEEIEKYIESPAWAEAGEAGQGQQGAGRG